MRRNVRVLSWIIIGCIGICGCSHKTTKPEVDYQAAEKEFDEYMENLDLPSLLFAKGQESEARFDVTGDGVDDLLRGATYGSGIIRETVLVYDPVTHTGRMLASSKDERIDGESDDVYCFKVDSCKKDSLIINRSGYIAGECLGTIILQDDELVFVPFNDNVLDAKGA